METIFFSQYILYYQYTVHEPKVSHPKVSHFGNIYPKSQSVTLFQSFFLKKWDNLGSRTVLSTIILNFALSDEFRSRWANIKHTHLKGLSDDDNKLLKYIKNNDRTKTLTQTSLNSNRSLMASFVRHLQSKNSHRRNPRSRTGSSRSREHEKSVSIKSSRISMHSADIKSLPAIEEST